MHQPPKLTKADKEDQDIEFHEDDENFIDDDVEEVKPEVKDRNFEFTSNVNIMRFMRAVFFLQVISLAIDNPSIDMPPMFRIMVNGLCFYSLRFYSRPFIDLVYAAQYYYGVVAAMILPYLPSKDAADGYQWGITTNIPLSARTLFTSENSESSFTSKTMSTLKSILVSILAPTYPIEQFSPLDSSQRMLKESTFKLSVIFEQHWHAIKFFSYFFFSLFFTILAVLYTFQMWEIKDYTDIGEVQMWLKVYIADGWFFRGGLRLGWSITQACLCMFLFVWFLYAVSHEVYSHGAIPANLHISTVLGIYVSIILIIWTIGYRGFKATEGAFIRYVSQNVTYTSTILLKRVVKAKTEIGLALMFLLYMPSLYFFAQSLVVILDWNDTIAMSHRKSVNFYVPCYFYAFPPYRHTARSPDTCDVSDSVESVWLDANPGKYGFYKDERIVSCDSYLGVTMYTLGFLCTVMLLSAYGWLFYEMIDLVSDEFRKSRWVGSFEVLRAKTFIENLRYKETFNYRERISMEIWREIKYQLVQWGLAVTFIVAESKNLMVHLFEISIAPIACVLGPIVFFGRRIMLICCNCWTVEGRTRRALQKRHKMRVARRNRTQMERDGLFRPKESFRKMLSFSTKSPSENLSDKEPSSWALSNALQSTKAFFGLSTKNGQSNFSSNNDFGDSGGLSTRDLNATNGSTGAFKSSMSMSERNVFDQNKNVSMNQTSYYFDEDDDEYDDTDEEPLPEITPVFEIIERNILYLLQCCGGWFYIVKGAVMVKDAVFKAILKSGIVGTIRMRSHFCLEFVRGHSNRELVGLGTDKKLHGAWRQEMNFTYREENVYVLQQRLKVELQKAKVEFVTDHLLVISVFDYTVDSAALFMLICQYKWERLWFSMVLWVEMSLYALLCAPSNYYLIWQVKACIIGGINICAIFGTYLIQPYSSDVDRWLDFLGRIMIVVVSFGFVLCQYLVPGTDADVKNVPYATYKPWISFNYIASLDMATAGEYIFVDVLMVVVVYLYMLGVLHQIGIFSALKQKLTLLLYTFHDHILDFIVAKLDERTFGPENVYTGLYFIQQWDDIIKHQRRYALIPHPDIRPQRILSLRAKYVEVKWAALFNMTITNIRSSLGLSLLHVAMCAADGESCRWLIHYYPELLVVEDSQRDTPVGIALKEAAYNLLRYSKMNDGMLDDHTSYEDDKYFCYYPEVPSIRRDVIENGEFLYENADVYILNSKEAVQLHEFGYFDEYVEPEEEEVVRKGPLTDKAKRMRLIRGGGGVGGRGGQSVASGSVAGGSVFSGSTMKSKVVEKPPFKFGLQPKKPLKKNKYNYSSNGSVASTKYSNSVCSGTDKSSKKVSGGVIKKDKVIRFPEDMINSNYESGQMGSWGVIGLRVPDVNLYVDEAFLSPNFIDIEAGMDKDLRYVIESCNKRGNVGSKNKATVDISVVANALPNEAMPYSHPGAALMRDWGTDVMVKDPYAFRNKMTKHYKDFKKKKAKCMNFFGCGSSSQQRDPYRGAGSLKMSQKFVDRDPDNKDSDTESQEDEDEEDAAFNEALSVTFSENDFGLGHALPIKQTQAQKAKAKKERQYKWKICKFAEILLSSEVLEKCSTLPWDISAYKALSKLASALQGRLAYSLAMVFNLNPPEGFARFSDWSSGVPGNVYEDGFLQEDNKVTKIIEGVVAIGTVASDMKKTVSNLKEYFAKLNRGKGGYSGASDVFNDRIVQYLAECYVCSRERCVLTDCELSGPGRIAYRALCRAMRLIDSSFVLPSIFVAPQHICVRYLELQKNELDDGDIVILADAVATQQQLILLDISHNRVGCRGIKVLCKVLKSHKTLTTFRANYNRIGPSVGLDIGLVLKFNKVLRILELNHNRIGPMIRYSSPYTREKIPSAVRDIFTGLKSNKGLQQLDLSYNHFGPEFTEYISIAVNKHGTLNHLELSGNDIGPVAGPSLIFSLAGQPGGDHMYLRREAFLKEFHARQAQRLADGEIGPNITKATSKATKKKIKKDEKKSAKIMQAMISDSESNIGSTASGGTLSNRPAVLAHLGMAENQLGTLAAHGFAAMLKRNKGLTSLDISSNSFGPVGGLIMSEAFERVLNITSRDEIKKALDAIQAKIMQGRNLVTKKLVYSNLTTLNVSRNGFGPAVCASWMYCVQSPNCPLVHFDISNNPLGHSVPNAGDAKLAAQDVRSALGKNTSLRMLNISKSVFAPTELVAVFGGLCMNTSIKELHLGDLVLDEPDCLQLAHAIDVCNNLNVIDIPNSKMGPKGAKLIIHQIGVHARRIKYVDFSNANLGLLGIVPLAHVLAQRDCAIQTLKVQNNNILDEGGEYIAKQLAHNHVLKYLDVSNNHLGRDSGLAFGDLGRGIHKEGKKIAHSPLRTFYIHDNPGIGYQGSRYLADGFVVSHLEKINMSNIGAGPHMAYTLAKAFRVATFTWLYCDISRNKLTRFGLNEICWSLRQNRRLRVVKLGDNDVGTDFCTNADQLGVHGIALPRAIRENVTLRELDLSHLGLNSEAAVILMESLTENYTIRKVNLSSNFLDDEVSYALGEMLRGNDIIEDLNLSNNKMAYNVCFVLAECLEANHSLLTLDMGKNSLGAAGTATVEAFCFALNMNCRLRSLILDTNRLGSEWGCLLADTFCRNNTLNRVSLLDNRLDKRAGQALKRAYAANGFLIELAVTRDEVGDDTFDEISRLMRKKKAVMTDAEIEEDTGIELELSKLLYEYY